MGGHVLQKYKERTIYTRTIPIGAQVLDAAEDKLKGSICANLSRRSTGNLQSLHQSYMLVI